MVKHLTTLVENFPGAANQTCCFTHILNLVAKSILCQFDMAKKMADDTPDSMKPLMHSHCWQKNLRIPGFQQTT